MFSLKCTKQVQQMGVLSINGELSADGELLSGKIPVLNLPPLFFCTSACFLRTWERFVFNHNDSYCQNNHTMNFWWKYLRGFVAIDNFFLNVFLCSFATISTRGGIHFFRDYDLVLFSLPYNCSTFAVLRHFVQYCTRQFNRKTIRAVVASVRESSLTASTVLSLPSCLESRL